jgi:hypothetical protein
MKIEVERRTDKGDEIIFETEDWDVVRVLDENKIIERFQNIKDERKCEI